MGSACHTRIDRSSKFLQQPEQQEAAFACFKKKGVEGEVERRTTKSSYLSFFSSMFNSNRSQLTETNNMILKNRSLSSHHPMSSIPHKNLSTLQPN